jgi:RHS repeat-associated protein
MPMRTWSDPNSKYKYGFNGKEKDNEVTVDGGDYDFGARIYDSRLGRWLVLDPVRNTSWSSFVSFKCSPISIIDPSGKTDFYNSGGDWIGTDGVEATSDIQRVITDNELANSIKETSLKGDNYILEIPNASYYELPSRNVIAAILNTYNQSMNDVISGGVKIATGGLHESGTTFDADGRQTPIVDGGDYTYTTDAHVYLPSSGTISIHTHPTEVIENKLTGKTRSSWADPSADDKSAFPFYGLNIIIGAETQQEYKQEPVPGGGTGQTRTIAVARNIVVNFFSNVGKKLFSINVSALEKINSGQGKSDSKTKKKYDKAKAKKTTSSGTSNH